MEHTREYVPLLVYGQGIKPKNLGTLSGLGTAAKLCAELPNISFTPDEYEAITNETIRENKQ